MSLLPLARSLLGGGHDDEPEEEVDSTYEGPTDDTQTLRIVSIFVILAAGLLGGLPPLFLKVFRNPDSPITKMIRAFAAGVILALALVHIIPEAVEEMDGLGGIEYPLGGTCVVFGIVLMIFLEHMAHLMNKGHHSHSSSSVATALTASGPVPPVSANATVTSTTLNPSPSAGASAKALGKQPSATQVASLPPYIALESATGQVEPTADGTGHGHVCVSRGPASNWLTAAAVEVVGSFRLKVIAYLFELGCIFHSFLIGLSLGVNKTDITEVRSLLIALAFHQFLEGVSLASVVVLGGFGPWRGSLMILTYSLTCPVGIAVGMGIAETYDAESDKARGIQGTFNGVSGGMLLYISLVQLIAEDMGRMVPGRDSALSRLGACLALFVGAASMCILAIWA